MMEGEKQELREGGNWEAQQVTWTLLLPLRRWDSACGRGGQREGREGESREASRGQSCELAGFIPCGD